MGRSEGARFKLKRKPSEEELEQTCEAAESAARRALFAEFDPKQISDFEIAIETVGDRPLYLSVEISVFSNFPPDRLKDIVDKACDEAFRAAEKKAKELNYA
ncbi:DUF3194 domain-containing protein [Candidatus Bathyarchaeota archaeon]|nr:DUF3194 domain-containing protein [Candidatus Bathyarchaeota archaeon]